MLDYTNDGAADPTGYQKLILENRNLFLGTTPYSIWVWLRRTRSPGVGGLISSERNISTDNYKGWIFYLNSSYYPQIQHGNGSSYVSCTQGNTLLATDTLYGVGFTWSGSAYQWWYNNGGDGGSGSFSTSISATSAGLTFGADDGASSQAFPGQVGPILAWPSRVLAQSDIETLYAGGLIPHVDEVQLFYRSTSIPGIEEYAGETPSQNGTIYLKSLDPPDTYYPEGLPSQAAQIQPWREVFSRELRRRRFPSELYSIRVPLEYLVLEVLDDLNISHDSLPRAESLLTDIDDHYLADKWRSMYAASGTQRIDLNNMSMEIDFVNLEPFICYAWSTDMAPYAATSDHDGLAQIDQGASWQVERSSAAWVEQADGLIATLGSGVARIGASGFLPCSGSENPIQNSTFYYDSGGPPYFPNWTQSGSGTFSSSVVFPLFVDDETYPNAIQIVKGAGDTYIEQGSISVSSTDGYRVLLLRYRNNLALPGTPVWQIERPGGGTEYWNNATPGWQGSSVWNSLASGEAWAEAISEPISTPATEDWTLRLGVTGTTTYGVEFALACLFEGSYILAPIPTIADNTYTTEDDLRYFEFDNNSTENHRVCVPMRCGTFRCRFTAFNDYDRMADDDVLTIGYAQFDSSGNNYDLYCYEKPAGGNHRFAFKRYRNGALEATAYKDEEIYRPSSWFAEGWFPEEWFPDGWFPSIGAYEVAFRWTWDEFGTASTNGSRDLDGSSDYYSLASDLSGNADSQKGIICASVKLDGGDAATLTLLHSTGDRLFFRRASSNKFQISAEDSGSTTRLNIRSTSTHTAGSDFIQVLASWDLSTTTTHFLINGVDVLDEVTADDATLDYTISGWAVGAQVGGSNYFNGKIAELYFAPGEYVDLSDSDNVALFFDGGKPTYLGGDGSLPTGSKPLIYLPSGNGVNNCGDGGNFTENGSPAAAAGPGPHRTLSVFVEGTKGTDAQAESNQASFDHEELCPDPTCATDFFDSKGTGWSHDSTNDEYDSDGSQSADSDLTEGSICVSGWIYRVEFEVKNCTAGNVCAVCGTQEGTDRAANGVYSEYITANGTDFIIRADADFIGSVTNIYVQRDKYSAFYPGTAPSATGYLPANNYIANWEIVQRAIPDEEIQARR